MKNIPTKIYLQLGPQAPDETDDFNEASKDGAVSWCADKVDGHDIEYIQKDGWPITIRPLKGYFVVVMDNGWVCNWSIAYRKKDAIGAFADGLGEKLPKAWDDAKKRGHRVMKVNITFDPA